MKEPNSFISPAVLLRGVASDTLPDWRVVALFSLLVLLGSFVPGSVVAQNHSEIFFDASGTDQAFFGPDQIVTISGNLTFYGRSDPQVQGGVPDTFLAISDIYVIPKGNLHTTVSRLPLHDVNGSPNTILGFTGGGFFEQVIAATMPQGNLKSGEYDIVVDEHQDTFFNPGYDLHIGGEGRTVLSVFVPSDVPGLPGAGIASMKQQAVAQFEVAARRAFDVQLIEVLLNLAQLVETGGNREQLFFLLEDMLKEKLLFGQQCDGCPSGSLIDGASSAPNLMNEASALLVQTTKKYNGIASDPPDPDFAQLVTLSFTPVSQRDGDALNSVTLPLNRAQQQESALADALLHALERYQGAQQAQNGYWSLAHAREIQMYAGLLAAQIPRTRTALASFRAGLAAEPRDLDGAAARIAALQARVQQQGFTVEETRALIGLGIPVVNLGDVVQAFTNRNYTFSRSTLLAGLDSQIQASSNAPQAYLDLAASMNSIITSLLAKPELETTQPTAQFTVPVSGSVGKSLAFDASTSSDPQGLPLAMRWDFNGNGQFTDATGTNVALIFTNAFTGHVGVSVTNTADRGSVAYAYLEVTDSGQPPVFTTLTPAGIVAAANVGATANFTATATDPDGDAVIYHWLVDGVEVRTGPDFTYNPAATNAGLHNLRVEARNGRGESGIAVHAWLIVVTTPVLLADLLVTQTDSPDPVVTGSNVTYAVTVKNQGPDTATGVTLTNVIPTGANFVSSVASQGTASQSGGVVTASLGDLPAGTFALVNITVSPTTPGILTNAAVAASSALDPNLADNTSMKLTRANAPNPNVADLSLSQSAAPTRGTVNNTLSYNLVINNLGTGLATGLTVVDTLPREVKFLSAIPVPDSVNGNVLSFSLPQIPAGGAGSVNIAVMPIAAGNPVNSAVATANETDPNLANNTSTQSTLVTAEAARFTDLAIGQVITPNPVTVNNQLTVTLTVTNLGPDDVTGATIVDALPAGLTFLSATPAPDLVSGGLVSFNLASLTNGQTATVVLQARPVSAGTLANTASVMAGDTDTNVSNNQSRLDILVNQSPVAQSDLAVSLASSTNQLPVGSNVTFTITVTNAGPDPATATVVTELLPTGLSLVTAGSSAGTVATQNGIITASIGTLASGASAAVTITGTALLGRPLVNVATVASVNNDPNSTNNTASSTVLAVDTSATVAIERNFADQEIDTLQAYLAEMGLGSQVFDQEGLTFAQVQSYRLIFWDDLSWASGGLVPNDVQILKSAHDAGARLYLIGDDLALSATFGLEEPERSIWAGLLHLNATTLNSGGDGTMRIVNTTHPVVNGPFGLVGNSVYYFDPDATLATGTGEVVLGRSGTDDVLLAYKDPVTKNKTVTQNELVHTQTDANGIVQRKILFQNAVTWLLSDDASVDLSVTQSTTSASVSVGGDLIYTISVANTGPDAASGVTLTDVLPVNATLVSAKFSQGAGSINSNILTANLGGLASSGNATITLHVIAGPEEVFTNVVSVLGLEDDSNTNNNVAVSLLTVGPIGSPGSVPKADVRVTQAAAPSLGLGRWLAYTLTVTNAGPYAATAVALSDLLPAGAEFLSAASSQGTAANSSGTVNAALGTIASGGSATVSIVVRPRTAGTYINNALVSSSTIDQNANNNASSWTTLVTAAPPAAKLLVDVRASAPSVPVGGNVTYLFTVANTGPDPATGVVLTDPLPAGMEFVSAGAGVTPVAGTLTFGIGSLVVGASATVTAVLRGAVPGDVVNTASAISNEGGRSSTSLSTEVFVPGPPPVDLAVLSSVSEKFVPVGTNMTYTIVVTNNSPTVATGVLLTNKLPAFTAFVSVTASRGVVTQTNGVITADLGNVTNNSPVTFTIQAIPIQPEILINRASVTSAEADADPADNVSYVLAMSEVLITAVDNLGTALRVSFNSVIGKNYMIQSRPDAASGLWVTVPGTTNPGNDHVLQITLPNAISQPQQFYRILQLP